MKIRSRPSSSACRRTRAEPGTTIIRTPSALVRPRRISEAARRSSIRELVHEPRNTVSTGISFMGVPGRRSMYCRALAAEAWALSSAKLPGSGTASDSGTPWPGLVPQVTKGSRASPSMTTSASKPAPSSVRRERQYCTARSHSCPCGACGRSLR
ncbi:Uncharacterised protein [Mycobacteroides abscessus subsp. abscessus]|nr:Uncharacterised protein [Mycobacteroides abscessus subsp. abscessus]